MLLPEFFDACDHCGERFERVTTYPVLTTADDDGAMQLFSFCDDECLSSWRESGGSIGELDGGGAEA